MKNIVFLILASFAISCTTSEAYEPMNNDKEAIGKLLFFDKNLSNPAGQSCASCHAPEVGFSDLQHNAVSEGAVKGAFSSRNAPALSYNIFAPTRNYNTTDETFIGGFFLDGRSLNLEEQLIHPFIGDAEMNNGTIEVVVEKIKAADYYPKLIEAYGVPKTDYELITFFSDALVKFETSNDVNPFTSKYDYYLQGRASFTVDEKRGLALFNDKAKCAQCHVNEPDSKIKKILFTDFSYDNIGVPRNETNPFYTQKANNLDANFVDFGIGKVVNDPKHNGKFKVPTLRNIAVTAPYFHNGSMNTLEKVLRFYNTRDVNPAAFDAPEVLENVNHEELGNLGLTTEEEQQIITFLKTLTDGYRQ
jgi:cytochrome c peroxidase